MFKGSIYRGVIFPMDAENWFEFAGLLNCRGFEKFGVKLQS